MRGGEFRILLRHHLERNPRPFPVFTHTHTHNLNKPFLSYFSPYKNITSMSFHNTYKFVLTFYRDVEYSTEQMFRIFQNRLPSTGLTGSLRRLPL